MFDKELDEAVSIIAEGELKRIIELRKINFLRSLIAFLMSFLIVVISILSVMLFDLKMDYTASWAVLFIMIVSMVFVAQGIRFLNIARDLKKLGGGNYQLKSVLACTNPSCDFTRERKWISGDFVGKILDDVCEKCGSKLQVIRIYGIPEKKLRSIPLLPGITQSYYREKRSFIRRLFGF